MRWNSAARQQRRELQSVTLQTQHTTDARFSHRDLGVTRVVRVPPVAPEAHWGGVLAIFHPGTLLKLLAGRQSPALFGLPALLLGLFSRVPGASPLYLLQAYTSFEQFTDKLPSDGARYAVIDWQETNDDDCIISKIFFVTW